MVPFGVPGTSYASVSYLFALGLEGDLGNRPPHQVIASPSSDVVLGDGLRFVIHYRDGVTSRY